MRTRLVTVAGPAVLALGLAVAITQIARGPSPASGESPDRGRPAAASDEIDTAYGDAQAVQQGAAAAAYADAMAQAEIQRYWQMMDDARRAEAARQTAASGPRRSSCTDPLACIRACESHGNYGAVSGGGTYRGAYQFSQTAWESVGGTGDPAAAPPAEQDARAAALYSQQGSSPWPNCG